MVSEKVGTHLNTLKCQCCKFLVRSPGTEWAEAEEYKIDKPK